MILALVGLLFLGGCTTKRAGGPLGLTEPKDCEPGAIKNDGTIMKVTDYAERMVCYHYAAVSIASISGTNNAAAKSNAQALCGKIISEIAGKKNIGDISARAYTEADLCYTDVAKLFRDEHICANIPIKGRSFGSSIVGDGANRKMCVDQARKLSKLGTAYHTGYGSMCNVIFILPALLILSFIYYRK